MTKRSFEVDSGQSAEQYMSQLLAQKRRKIGDDDESDDTDEDEDSGEHFGKAGYIKKLVLKNFMCHDHFELDFGPQMNFIIGRNGSGKSAILTGISVGLGSKAHDTSRGSLTKSLIKDGKSTARITVELDNSGFDAFEKAVYGSTIIIERKLLREGTNSYSIKSENGSMVSNRKKTLDDILQKFFIVVNNPLSFLSQDKAREFIASSTEQSRFSYFSEGTNIQLILLNYQDASKNILNLQQRLMAAKTHYEDACRKYAECERTYKKYKHLHNLREQSEKINGKMYWFNVEVMERRIKKKEAEIAQKRQEIAEIQESSQQKGLSIEGHKKDVDKLQKEILENEKKLAESSESVSEIQEKSEKARDLVQQLKNDLITYKSEIDNFSKKIQQYERDIKDEQRKIDEINGGSKEEMREKLEALRNREKELIDKRDALQDELRLLDDVTPEMNECSRALEDVRNQKVSINEQLRTFNQGKNDKYAAYGYNMNSLMRDIQQEKRWHKKPLGPVGCFVSVKEQYSRWSDLVNAFLQRVLDSFVVCDEHDRAILNEYMRQKKIHKGIIVRNFETFKFSQVSINGCVTVLELLDIHDENILYTLIDANNIEETVICDLIKEAEQYLKVNGVRHTFCLNDRKSGIRLTRNSGSLVRDPVFYTHDLHKLARTSSSDDKLRNELEELMKEEEKWALRRNQLKQKQFQKKKEIQRILEEKKRQLKSIQGHIFSTERVLEEEGDHGRIESLQFQIESCEAQIKTREGVSLEVLENLKKAKKEYSAVKHQLEAALAEKKDISAELADLQERIDRYKQNIDKAKADIYAFQEQQAEIETEIENKQHKLEEDHQKHQDIRSEAEQRCSRDEITITEEDTTESITTEYMNIQQAIEEIENNNSMSFEAILDDLLEAKRIKNKCEESLSDLDNARVKLENDLNLRFENLNITIKEKLTRAKSSFEHCLALRGFKGKLEFDFARKRVITEVQTKDDKETRAVQSLSGGEKSFTQIAFLLSIWKVMKPRVCGLDEFDVFMDSVNRTIAIRLLIHELRASSAQSIFITPQDIAAVGDLQDAEDVRIHRIKPPRND